MRIFAMFVPMNGRFSRIFLVFLGSLRFSESALLPRAFALTLSILSCSHYLETLCDYLYDSLRPRILHETKLEVLCELCNVVQALISLDGDAEDDDDSNAIESVPAESVDEEQTEADSSFDVSTQTATLPDYTPHEDKLRFSLLLNTVLQDAQTRLVFRAQYVMESEVLHYNPRPEDLEYPEKLQMSKAVDVKQDKGKERDMKADKDTTMGIVEEDGVVIFRLPPESVSQNWYPTLQKTLWILSRLHSYVNVSESISSI